MVLSEEPAVNAQQQQPDGSWAPAQPLGYQPGYDIERSGRHWELFRTTRYDYTLVAQGTSTLAMIAAYTWHRLRHPV
jgi:hypothetical protein